MYARCIHTYVHASDRCHRRFASCRGAACRPSDTDTVLCMRLAQRTHASPHSARCGLLYSRVDIEYAFDAILLCGNRKRVPRSAPVQFPSFHSRKSDDHDVRSASQPMGRVSIYYRVDKCSSSTKTDKQRVRARGATGRCTTVSETELGDDAIAVCFTLKCQFCMDGNVCAETENEKE